VRPLSLEGHRLDLVIFDLDGVLVDTSDKHARAFEETWSRVGVEGPPYAAVAGQPTTEVVARVCAPLGLSEDAIADLVRFKQSRARELVAAGDVAFPDVAATLDRLAPRVKLAIGTGASRAGTVAVLPQLGGEARFEAVVTADDVTKGKPAPEVYGTVLERCGIPSARALVVEDSASGVAAALEAGTLVVVVRARVDVQARRCLGFFPDLRVLADALGAS